MPVSFKQYGNEVQITVYAGHSRDKFPHFGHSVSRDYAQESFARSKRKIHEYVRCNKWTSFITITIDSDKVENRYDDNCVLKHLRCALQDYKRLYPLFACILVYERHNDNALHFHGLCNIPCHKSNNDVKYMGNYRAKNGRWYSRFRSNFLYSRLGAVTVSPISVGVSTVSLYNYCLKYMTKDLVKDCGHIYYATRNLDKATVLPYVVTSYSDPFLIRLHEKSRRIVFNEFCEVWLCHSYIFEQIVSRCYLPFLLDKISISKSLT